jgi:citrate synthase
MKLTVEAGFIPELNEKQAELLGLVLEAHNRAALDNPNASSGACVNAVAGTGRVENGIASAILTLGPTHGPVQDARYVYEMFEPEHIRMYIDNGRKVPGFGNSFFRDGIDPAWKPVDQFIREHFKRIALRIDGLTKAMSESGKTLHPNAALYTAAVCSEIGVQKGAEAALFIIARIPAWVHLSLGNG